MNISIIILDFVYLFIYFGQTSHHIHVIKSPSSGVTHDSNPNSGIQILTSRTCFKLDFSVPWISHLWHGGNRDPPLNVVMRIKWGCEGKAHSLTQNYSDKISSGYFGYKRGAYTSIKNRREGQLVCTHFHKKGDIGCCAGVHSLWKDYVSLNLSDDSKICLFQKSIHLVKYF